MTQFENADTQNAEVSNEEQLKLAEAARRELDAYNQMLLEKRKAKKSKLGKAAVFGMFGVQSATVDPLAAEFTIQGTLPNIDDNRPNLVPNTAYDKDNENDFIYIGVPRWDDTADPSYAGLSRDLVIIMIDGVPLDIDATGEEPASFDYPTPDDTIFPVQVYVTPAMLENLSEGIHRLSYRVMNDTAQNPDDSLAQEITLDRIAPSPNRDPAALLRPTGVPASGIITKEFLDANATITFPVPDYQVARKGDTIEVYEFASNTPIFEGPIWPEDQPARLPGVTLTAAAITALASGPKQLVYKLKDRALNTSGASVALPVVIQLAPEPGTLLPPEVPASPINRAKAAAGVDIIIPAYDNSQPNDDIVVSWETPQGVIQLPSFKRSVGQTSVDWAFLSTPDPRAVYTARVTYTVNRGSDVFGPSPTNNVPVNLRVVGPVNPDEPDPVNPLLTKLVVRGGSSGVDNQITPADKDLDANIRFTVYEGAAPDQVVHFFYKGVEVLPALTLTTQQAGDLINIPLPWAAVQAAGNGVIPAYYTVYENSTAENFQQSTNTNVRVSVITVPITNFVEYDYPTTVKPAQQNKRPGTPLNQTGIINCSSAPWRGVKLKIRYTGTEIQVGDIISLKWVFSKDSTGENEQPAMTYETQITVSQAQDRVKAVDITVPYGRLYFGDDIEPEPVTPVAIIGSIVCSFTVVRGNVAGQSEKTIVKYNTLQGGRVCSAWGN